jgi:hypothetical protein
VLALKEAVDVIMSVDELPRVLEAARRGAGMRGLEGAMSCIRNASKGVHFAQFTRCADQAVRDAFVINLRRFRPRNEMNLLLKHGD